MKLIKPNTFNKGITIIDPACILPREFPCKKRRTISIPLISSPCTPASIKTEGPSILLLNTCASIEISVSDGNHGLGDP